MLTDGHTSFTPGISEYNGLGSRFSVADAQGNSRGLLDGGQSAQDGYNWDAFGGLMSRFGSNPTAYAWNGGAGYQSDGDSGLKLLGHRYYDSRTGRFLSQDPAGDGDNWYAYCANDPMNGSDPLGLRCPPFDSSGMSFNQIYDHVLANGGLPGESYQTTQGDKTISSFMISSADFTHIIPGFNVSQNFREAKQFAHTPLAQFAYPKLGGSGYGVAKLLYPNASLKTAYLIQHVKPGSVGDPKSLLKGGANNPMYQYYDTLGQYNFGAVLAGLGLNLKFGLVGAGGAQTVESILQGHALDNLMQNGWVGSGPPWGDDANSQYWIKQGYNDYKNR